MNDILIKNTRVFFRNILQPGEVLIDEGKIKRIAKDLKGENADLVIDAKGALTLPSGIDVHVHFREPGMEHKEDWFTGSCSAAAGGITSVVEQPNTIPPTTDKKSFRQKLKLATRKSVIDFGINGGVTAATEKLAGLWESGVLAFGEIFMAESTAGLGIGDETFHEAIREIGELGALPTIHAEDEELRLKNEALLKKDYSPQSHSRVRSNICEALAVKKAIDKLTELKTKGHLCHISTIEAVGLIRNRKYLQSETGLPPLTAEVAPHHLFLSVKDWDKLGSFGKMNPPLRERHSVKALINAINDGTIDMIASDHAPHREFEKEEDIKSAPAGVPGVETLMPLMLMAVKKNLLPLGRMIELTSAAPARVFGLDRHGKGTFAAGYDADLIIANPQDVRSIKGDLLHSKAGWTPYEDMDGIFPSYTIARGEIVWDGEVIGKKGRGEFLPGKGLPAVKE
jgi:dihydroorotase